MTDTERLEALNLLASQFLDNAREMGVEDSLIALMVPGATGPEARVRVHGDSFSLITLLGSLIQQLTPQDFALLYGAMQSDVAFALQRVSTEKVVIH